MLEYIPLNYYALTGLLNFLTSFALSIFVFYKNPKSRINQTFSLFAFTVAGWSLCYFLWLNTEKSYQAEFYLRTLMLFVIFIPSTFTHFVLTFLKVDLDKRINLGNYLISILLGCTVYSRLFASDISPFLVFPYWLKPRFLFGLHSIHFFANIIYSHYLMLRSVRHNSGIFRNQILYVLIGTAIGYSAGAINYLTWYRIPIPPFLNIFVSVYVVMVAIAILKHRLMDITLVWRQVLIFAGYFITVCGLSVLIFLVSRNYPLISAFIVFLLLLTAPFSHRILQRFSQPIVDKVILKDKYSYWDKLAKFWEKERIVYTSGQLADALAEIPEVMGLESFSFFLFNRDRRVFAPYAYKGLEGVFNSDPEQAKVLNTIYPDDYLVMYLEREKRIVIREELTAQKQVEDKDLIIAEMDELKSKISAPLFVAERLTAILNLGSKKDQEIFHQQDIELLKEVTQGAQRHLGHIAFFENSLIFSGSVAHDIRKSFRQGILYSYLDTLQKGALNPTQRQALDNLKERLVSLHNMSEEMVNAFKGLEIFLKGGFRPQKIDYLQKLNEKITLYRKMAQEKGLTFETLLPKRVFIYADPLSIERILDELLSNALKFTDQGRIMLKASYENPEEVLTEISDTGCGIPQENQEEIWELFKRVEDGKAKEGAGIGLAMVRQLVEANAGKIWVNSQREKGSTFFFTLPNWEEKK